MSLITLQKSYHIHSQKLTFFSKLEVLIITGKKISSTISLPPISYINNLNRPETGTNVSKN